MLLSKENNHNDTLIIKEMTQIKLPVSLFYVLPLEMLYRMHRKYYRIYSHDEYLHKLILQMKLSIEGCSRNFAHKPKPDVVSLI